MSITKACTFKYETNRNKNSQYHLIRNMLFQLKKMSTIKVFVFCILTAVYIQCDKPHNVTAAVAPCVRIGKIVSHTEDI